ncbi:MAG: hypothetical protein AB8B53_06535 [Flavobacteriales bacterium]
MNKLTVRDIGNYKRPKPKLRGVRVDFRWSTSTAYEDRELIMVELLKVLKTEGLTMSGFGKDSYSGIISAAITVPVLKRKIERIKDWLAVNQERFNLFRTGKIHWVDDIYFE